MAAEMFSKCRECGNGFFYSRVGLHSRLRVYCDRCKRKHVREAGKLRQRKHREHKRDVVRSDSKGHDEALSRPSADGSRDAVSRAVSGIEGRGMYAASPEPTRSIQRKKVGLK